MFTTIKKVGCSIALAAGLFSPLTSVAETMKEINFGIIATDAQQNLKQRWEPMLEDLSEELGIKVNAYFAPDYAGIIQGMRFKKVDFAYFGNKSAMEAVDRANAEIFARYIDEDGTQGYYSVLLVNSDNDDINTLQDVIDNRKELMLGNGEPNSTSGFLVPNYYAFAQNHISANDFKRTIVASHGANAMAVANKQVDVATNHTMNLTRLEKSNPALFSKLKVVWQSELIPSDVITWRKDIPADIKAQARDFFLAYGEDNSQQQDNLKLLAWSGFAPADNNQLLPIRQMEAYKGLVETQDNPRLSDKEKKERIAQYQAELDSLASEIEALNVSQTSDMDSEQAQG